MQYNILQYLSKTVEVFPQSTAVIEGETMISFNELNQKSQKLALHIINNKDVINKPIAVFLPKSIESIIANIGITYSGNIYMNLDIKTPLERIKNILELVQPSIIITNSKFKNSIEELPLENVTVIDFLDIDFNIEINSHKIFSRLENIIDTDPYCIINTSGSTGTPKGVVLNHKSFIDFLEWSDGVFKFSNDETIGSLSPLVFDIYSFELCLLMAKGNTILLIPDTLSAFPIKILELLDRHTVTFLFWVPTIMVNIANMDLLSQIELPNLNKVWFAGEVFPTKQFNYWYKKLPQTLFANLYGPIEITLDCTYFIIDRDIPDNEALPIGFACKNTEVLILTDQNQIAIEGEEGELCVRGTSLAMGYYNNPEKTAAAFVQNPLNKSYPEIIYRTGDIVSKNGRGEIIFRGRKDSLVKHLGYRIELGEIEHVIVNTLKLCKNGCVIYNFTKREITLFYESRDEIMPATFRKEIMKALPKYMIPTVYHRIDEMPRNTNGKIDRLKLNNQINDK